MDGRGQVGRRGDVHHCGRPEALHVAQEDAPDVKHRSHEAPHLRGQPVADVTAGAKTKKVKRRHTATNQNNYHHDCHRIIFKTCRATNIKPTNAF